jgi:N,N'-diacetyllegionaminate synthase
MVNRICILETMMGNGLKITTDSELETKQNIRRSIVAKHDLDTDQVITLNDLNWVRPGNGLNPGNEEKIIGKILKKSIKVGRHINKELLY